MAKENQPADVLFPLGIETKEKFVKNVNLNISQEAQEIRLAIAKVKKLNDQLKFLADKTHPKTEAQYAVSYAKSAYNLLADSLKYDHASWDYLQKLGHDAPNYTKEYNKLLSLRFAILRNTGVCRQFSDFLTMLISNEESGIVQNCSNCVYDQKLITTTKHQNKTIGHELNVLNYTDSSENPKNIILDVTRAILVKDAGYNKMDYFTKSINKYSDTIEQVFREVLQPKADILEFYKASAEELYYLTQCQRYSYGEQNGYRAEKNADIFERFE